MKTLTGKLNETRLAIVKETFQSLNLVEGSIKVNDLVDSANTSKHPRVVDGTTTLEEFIALFRSQWDYLQGGNVTEDEFIAFYEAISTNMKCDKELTNRLKFAWGKSTEEPANV